MTKRTPSGETNEEQSSHRDVWGCRVSMNLEKAKDKTYEKNEKQLREIGRSSIAIGCGDPS